MILLLALQVNARLESELKFSARMKDEAERTRIELQAALAAQGGGSSGSAWGSQVRSTVRPLALQSKAALNRVGPQCAVCQQPKACCLMKDGRMIEQSEAHVPPPPWLCLLQESDQERMARRHLERQLAEVGPWAPQPSPAFPTAHARRRCSNSC